jgi:TrmH family RNA methyltransferase
MGPSSPPLAAANPRIKQLRRLLGRRSARRDAGRLVLEGPILVAEALAAGVVVHDVFVDAALLPPDDGAGRWSWLGDVAPGALHPVASGVLGRVLDTATPQPVAAVVDLPTTSLSEVVAPATDPPFLIVLAGLADPGNVGTVIRSAAAAGASVLLTDDTADPFNPKAVRASAGAVLRTPLAEVGIATLLAELAASEVPLWVADAGGGAVPDESPLAGPVALVVGNEAHGVPAEIAAAAAGRLRIPMASGTESLNAATAAGILLFEVARQRRARRTDGHPPEATA